MAETTIEWTRGPNGEKGFTKVGPGCDHCYAEAGFDKRLKVAKWGAGQPRKRTSPGNWLLPLRWNAEAERLGVRYRVFCASLADVFDNEVPAEWRDDLFDLIGATPHLDWLLVTKRIGNVRQMIPDRWSVRTPINLWLGITVVNQAEADRDIPKLISLEVAVRFLSMEPLLGNVDILKWLDPWTCADCEFHGSENECGPDGCAKCGNENAFDNSDSCLHCGADDQSAKPSCPNCGSHRSFERDYGFKFDSERKLIDWVIVGGESGPGARPMHPQWVRDIRDQCIDAGVPFFFKQWGEWANAESAGITLDAAYESKTGGWVSIGGEVSTGESAKPRATSDAHVFRLGKKAAGRLLDGVEHNGLPEVLR